jgi:hypothetical protein
MANDEDLARLRQGVAAWNARRAQNRERPVDLTDAYLAGANLERASLWRASLWRANLGGVDLLAQALPAEADSCQGCKFKNLTYELLKGSKVVGAGSDAELVVTEVTKNENKKYSVLVSGVVRATVNGQKVEQQFSRVEAQVREVTTGASDNLQVQQAVCPILHLDLGPIFLDVLGLEIDLSRIILDVTAVSGPGKLLGNLLCALLGLLD